MVKGPDLFRQHFAGYADRYVLIGGTAASLAMEDAGLEPVAANAAAIEPSRLENRQQPAPKFRDPVLNDVPHQLEIDPEVVVNQAIAHAGRGSPFDGRVNRAEVIRELLGRLADDLQTLRCPGRAGGCREPEAAGHSRRERGPVRPTPARVPDGRDR